MNYDYEPWSTPDDFKLVDIEEPGEKSIAPTREAAIWEWVGRPIPQLQEQVERLLRSEDVNQRVRAFRALDAYREKASHGAYLDAIETFAADAGLSPQTVSGSGKRKRAPATIRLTDADGRVTYRNVGSDVGAARELLETAALEAGWPLRELAQPLPPGKPTAATADRRAALASLVRYARSCDATLDAIGEVLAMRKQRVFDLQRHGKAA